MYNKSLVTISQILDAAQQLFIVKNYDDITMAEIARTANVTKGAIYHHINGKEALFLKMMVRYLDRLQVRLQMAVDTGGTARERLTQLTTLYLSMPLEDQRVVQLVRRDSNRFTGETRDKLVAAYQNALPNQIESIIADGITAGDVATGDARLMAWHYVAIVEVSLTAYARNQFADAGAMAAYTTNVFLDGVGARMNMVA